VRTRNARVVIESAACALEKKSDAE
jgi:hypothetical protein